MVLIDDQRDSLPNESIRMKSKYLLRRRLNILFRTSNWICKIRISFDRSARSDRRARAARQSASNNGYKSTGGKCSSCFSKTFSNNSSISSAIPSSPSSSSSFSLSDEVYSAIRLVFFSFFDGLLSIIVCERFLPR